MDSQKPILILGGLIYRGYRYIRNRGIKRKTDNKEVIYWRCHDRSCPGKMTTIGNEIEVSNVSNHTHAPDMEKCEAKRIRSDLVKRAEMQPSTASTEVNISTVFTILYLQVYNCRITTYLQTLNGL